MDYPTVKDLAVSENAVDIETSGGCFSLQIFLIHTDSTDIAPNGPAMSALLTGQRLRRIKIVLFIRNRDWIQDRS